VVRSILESSKTEVKKEAFFSLGLVTKQCGYPTAADVSVFPAKWNCLTDKREVITGKYS
jgi:hypothetical protein